MANLPHSVEFGLKHEAFLIGQFLHQDNVILRSLFKILVGLVQRAVERFLDRAFSAGKTPVLLGFLGIKKQQA